MQTSVTNTMAFGFPGEHANGQPFRADSYIASGTVTFGQPATSDGVVDGFKKAKAATNATIIGVFVSPHQHVRFALPEASRAITADAGTTVCVANKGSWYIEVSGLAASTTLAIGDEIEVSNAGAWAKKSSGTAVAKVTDIGEAVSYTSGSSTLYKVVALVTLY